MARFAFDPGAQAQDSFAAKVATFTGDEFVINHLGTVDISWERILPGTAPSAQQTDLEVCNGDPTVAANWSQLDTENTVAVAIIRKSVANVAATAVRARLVSIGTANGGVTARITVRSRVRN